MGRKNRQSPGYREQKKRDQKKLHRAIALWLKDYKLQSGCEICGYKKESSALEFHHTDESTKDPFLKSGRSFTHLLSWLKLFREIKKCIVVCANCHREIHAGHYPEYICNEVNEPKLAGVKNFIQIEFNF